MHKRLKTTREDREQLRLSGDALNIGWFFAAAILVGYLLGSWLDRVFGWAPYGAALGVLLGIGAGFENLVRIAREASRIEDERALRKKQAARGGEPAPEPEPREPPEFDEDDPLAPPMDRFPPFREPPP